MSDEPDEAGGGAQARRPSPTSRARRIGGRAAARPGPAASASAPSTAAVSTHKPPRPTPPGATPAPAPTPTPTPTPTSTPTSTGGQTPTTSAPTPTAATASGPGHGLPWRWIPAAVLGLAAAVLLAVLVVSSHGVYWAKPDTSSSARASRQQDLLTATTGCFAKINTYDYRKLDGLVQRDLACVTGRFTGDLRRSLTTLIIAKAPKVKATQTAQVNKAGIATVNDAGTQATVLIYGQLAISNSTTAKKEPRIDVIGAVVTVNKVGGKWLISKVDTDVGALGS